MFSTITLPANQARKEAELQELASMESRSIGDRLKARADYLHECASGDGDITRIPLADGRFIELAIRKQSFLDDIALRTDTTAETPLAWKSEYDPVVGVTTGSTYGMGTTTLYATQQNHAFLNPFFYDSTSQAIPTMAFNQDVNKLRLRDKANARLIEALRLREETFLVNVLTEQPMGTDIPTCITNYWSAGASYSNKTVYVADPGVQSGTYETTNLIDASVEAGFTPAVFEYLLIQQMMTGRTVRTIHCPTQGFPLRKLLRAATVVANASNFTSGNAPNTSLESVPVAQWEKLYNMDISSAMQQGVTLDFFGNRFKVKSNNVLPQGYCIVTTDQPAAEWFNVTDRSVSVDLADEKNPFFTQRFEKRMAAIGAPHPWVRNFWILKIGNTSF